jgi:hypothetical protein
MKTATSTRPVVLTLIGVLLGVAALALGVQAAVSATAVAAPVIAAKPATLSAGTSATFTFTGPKGAALRCSLDAAAFTACTSPKNYSGLGQGTHTFRVKAVVGADESAATAYTWTVDTVAPPAPLLTSKPSDPTRNATNTFVWTDTETSAKFECAVESGAWATCASPYTWVLVDTNYGQHQFAVRAIDAAGNVSAEAAYRFKYEKNLPTSGIPFSVSGSVGGLAIGIWRPVVVTISNPNSVDIRVSALTVAVAADSTPSGCRSDSNIAVQQSDISPALTVTVPANGKVTLPAQGARTPQIQLKNLPNVNQDVCKNKSFALSYSGTATN